MTENHKELLDWSDLYEDGETQRAREQGAARQASELDADLPGLESHHHREVGQRGSAAREPRGSSAHRSAGGERQARDLQGNLSDSEDDSGHSPTVHGARVSTSFLDRQGVQRQPTSPNYGRLLNFSEEQQQDAARRTQAQRPQSRPRLQKPNCTVPATTSRLERLAQPRRYADPEEADGRAERTPRAVLPAGVAPVHDRLSKPRTEMAPTRTALSPAGPPARKGRSSSVRSPRGNADAMNRLAQPKNRVQRLDEIEEHLASYKKPSKQYGGTTHVDYEPMQIPQPRKPHRGRATTEPVWTNLKKPRPVSLPAAGRGDGAAHQGAYPPCQCPQHHLLLQEQQKQQVSLPTTPAMVPGPTVVHSEPAAPLSKTATPAPPPDHPKPPMQVRTKRSNPTDEAPVWPPKEPEKSPSKTPPPVTVYAAQRTPTPQPTDPAELQGQSLQQPLPPVSLPPAKPVPAKLAVRRAKPAAAEQSAAQPLPPLDVPVPETAPEVARIPASPPVEAPVASAPAEDSLQGSANGTRSPLKSSLENSQSRLYEAPPARPRIIKVRKDPPKRK